MKEKRNLIPVEKRRLKDALIFDKILNHPMYAACNKLLCYINMGSEVETTKLINHALSMGKIVAVPFARPKTRNMYFIKIAGFDNLVKSRYGALEPAYNTDNIITPDRDTLIIVPGLAFDSSGYRLGYGGGYYDTYAENNPEGLRVGLAYSEMVVKRVPIEVHDRHVDVLITDGI
jgi:5-formyltetrahydrofolate cyclo-ligase